MSRMLVCFGINGTDTVIALAIEVFRLESNSNRAPLQHLGLLVAFRHRLRMKKTQRRYLLQLDRFIPHSLGNHSNPLV